MLELSPSDFIAFCQDVLGTKDYPTREDPANREVLARLESPEEVYRHDRGNRASTGIPNAADGACMFRSLAQGVNILQAPHDDRGDIVLPIISHKELRRNIVAALGGWIFVRDNLRAKSHPSALEREMMTAIDNMVITDSEVDDPFAVRLMANPFEFGTVRELKAFVELYGFTVVLYQYNSNTGRHTKTEVYRPSHLRVDLLKALWVQLGAEVYRDLFKGTLKLRNDGGVIELIYMCSGNGRTGHYEIRNTNNEYWDLDSFVDVFLGGGYLMPSQAMSAWIRDNLVVPFTHRERTTRQERTTGQGRTGTVSLRSKSAGPSRGSSWA